MTADRTCLWHRRSLLPRHGLLTPSTPRAWTHDRTFCSPVFQPPLLHLRFKPRHQRVTSPPQQQDGYCYTLLSSPCYHPTPSSSRSSDTQTLRAFKCTRCHHPLIITPLGMSLLGSVKRCQLSRLEVLLPLVSLLGGCAL